MHPGCQAKTVKKEHCPDGKIRSENDIVCHACPLGKIPNSAKNGCLPCPNGMVSDGFNCSPCLIDNKANIGWFEQPHYNLKTLKNLVLKITGTQGVSRSQKIASKELLRVVDDQTPFGPYDIDEQVKALILDTGVQPDCIVFLKCPVGTKIKDLNCHPCHDDWRNDPLEESKCLTNLTEPFTGQFYYLVIFYRLFNDNNLDYPLKGRKITNFSATYVWATFIRLNKLK